MRVLVTGATGFIGSHLVERLAGDGHDVRALVRPASDATRQAAVAEIVRGDVLSANDAERAVGGCDLVYHLAGQVDRSIREHEMRLLHVGGTVNVARAASRAGARLLLASSTAVYGIVRDHAIHEETPLAPDSPYARTKVVAERVLHDSRAGNGLDFVIVRPCHVFGAGDIRWLQIFRLIAHGRFRLVGDGDRLDHSAYLHDAVDGVVRAAERGRPGRTYILAGPEPTTFRKLIALIAEAVGAPEPPPGVGEWPYRAYRRLHDVLPGGLGDRLPRYDRVEFFLKSRAYDITRARKELGFVPSVRVEDAIRELGAWMRERGLLASPTGG